jgi:hypothetical protein
MGAKYLPTVKDLKATRRYQEKQARREREKKLAAGRPAPINPKK